MLFLDARDYPTIESAERAYPGAYRIISVTGGWMMFETQSDYDTWVKQV